MIVITKTHFNGIYKTEVRMFKRKGLKYYLFIIQMKLKHVDTQIIEGSD